VLNFTIGKQHVGMVGEVSSEQLAGFDIKQPVYFIDIDFAQLLKLFEKRKIKYTEVSKFPAVQRDLALVVDKTISFDAVEKSVQKAKLQKLQSIRLFDVFESEKLGEGKKSLAVNFTFADEEKTLTDKEIEGFTNKLIKAFEEDLNAEIRK
jgi:phenylalanyl-tRNA synthetase beta chain